MNLLGLNIGKEFQKQMQNWLERNPDVGHEWKANALLIDHPKKEDKRFVFSYNAKEVTIEFEGKKAVFQRQFFKRNSRVVYDLRCYWMHTFINTDDLRREQPKLLPNQVSAMMCNRKFGHVLTINKHVFTGWGSVYQVFDNIEEAKSKMKEQLSGDEIEVHFYDHRYEWIQEVVE